MREAMFDPNKIALIGVPSSAGARQRGQEQAPRALRRAGLPERLRAAGRDVLDLGDLPSVAFHPDARNPKRQNLALVVGVAEQVAGAVDAALTARAWPLVVGGDCTLSIGILATLARRLPSLGLLYLDGDVDLNTPETTASGIFDGMVIAHILGKGAQELSRLGPRHPLLEEQNVTLFGYSARAGGLDPVEIELLRDSRMARYPLEEIEGDPRAFAARALSELEGRVEHILVHFDVDVIDVADFAAVDVPHDPGLSLTGTKEALQVFLASPRVVGLAVTEFNPAGDADDQLAHRLVDTLADAIGGERG
ncbi:MAG TPA: arginase family protein [Myxococcota bacterium]